jgi:hypothetical protein
MNLDLECSRIVLFVKVIRTIGAFYRDMLGLSQKVTPRRPERLARVSGGCHQYCAARKRYGEQSQTPTKYHVLHAICRHHSSNAN